MLIAYRGILPQVAVDAYVAPTATVIGDVQIGSEAGIWFGVILRGDVNAIRIGRRTNLQDGTIVHVTSGTHPTVIGEHSLVASGSLVVPGTIVPPRSLVIGSPARVKRILNEQEEEHLEQLAARYVAYRLDYL